MADNPATDRRSEPRTKGPFDGHWDGAGPLRGRVVDLSVSGCFIESMMRPSIGSVVMVTIAIGAAEVALPGEVVYIDTNLGFAVRFKETPDAIIEILRREVASRLPG